MQRQEVFEPLIVPVYEDRTHQWLSYFEASRLFAEKVARESMGYSATYPQPQGYPAQPDPNQYSAHNQPPVGGYGQSQQAPPYNPYSYQQQPNPYPQPYAYPPAQPQGQYQPPANYGQPPNPVAPQQPGYYPPQPNAWGQVSYPSQPYASPHVSGYPPQPATGQYTSYPATNTMPQPQVYQYPAYDQSTNYNYGISDQKPVEKRSNKSHQLDEKVTRASYHVHAEPPSAKPELGQQNLSNFLDEDIKSDSSQYGYSQHYYDRPSPNHPQRTINEPSVVEKHYERNAYAPGIGAIGWNI